MLWYELLKADASLDINLDLDLNFFILPPHIHSSTSSVCAGTDIAE